MAGGLDVEMTEADSLFVLCDDGSLLAELPMIRDPKTGVWDYTDDDAPYAPILFSGWKWEGQGKCSHIAGYNADRLVAIGIPAASPLGQVLLARGW